MLYSIIKPLSERPRLIGKLLLITSALAIVTNLVNLGIPNPSKWLAGVVMAGICLAAVGGSVYGGADQRRTLFWPLTISFTAGTAVFIIKQLLTDAGRLSQSPEVGAVQDAALKNMPLFLWTIALGVMWAWSASARVDMSETESTGWFRFWEDRPKLVWGVLGAITLGGAVVRFWAVGRLGLWSDESIVFIAAQNIVKTGLPYLETQLLYLRDLPHLYATAGAMWLFNDVEFATRLPSVISGILLVPATFLLSQRLFRQKAVSLLAAAIIAFHPWMIEYSRFGRSYMMMMLWIYLAVLFFQTGLTSRWSRVGLAVAGFLAATTHQVGQIVLMLAVVALLDREWRRQPLKLWPFLGAVAGIAAFKISFSYGYYYAQDAVVSISTQSAVARRIPFGMPRFANMLVFLRVVPFFMLISSIAALVRSRWLGVKANNYFYYSAFFLVITTSLLLSKKFISLNRGILFFFPLLALGTAFFTLFAVNFIRSKAGRAVAGILLIVLIAAYGVYGLRTANNRNYGSKINPNFAPFDGFTFYHDNKTPIQHVNARWQPGDQIIVMGMPNFWVAYSDLRPDWRIWSGSSIKYKGKNIFVGTPETKSLNKWDRLLKGKRTWVVTSYSIQWTPRIAHINPAFTNDLENYSGQKTYMSKDQTAKVYLIDNRPAKKKRRAVLP